MARFLAALAIIASAPFVLAAPAEAAHQRTESDALSPVAQWGRDLADEGTFWLDDNSDREVIRYTTPRDVRLCLPEPRGVDADDERFQVRVTWDQTNSIVLYPGNCMFFDARRVSLRPVTDMPANMVIRGSISTGPR